MSHRAGHLAWILALAVLATACVDDGPCDRVNSAPSCRPPPTRVELDVSEVDLVEVAPTMPPPLPYRYVRINDLSDMPHSVNGGADIDAIILDKADGTQAFATTVEGYHYGGGMDTGLGHPSPTEALFAPDAFVDYTAPDPACDLDDGYISLGGLGGLLIVGMGAEIEAGDTLTVLEIGGCTGNDGPQGIIEAVQVQVAVGFDFDEQWQIVGQGEGPVLVLTVPQLPAVQP